MTAHRLPEWRYQLRRTMALTLIVTVAFLTLLAFLELTGLELRDGPDVWQLPATL